MKCLSREHTNACARAFAIIISGVVFILRRRFFFVEKRVREQRAAAKREDEEKNNVTNRMTRVYASARTLIYIVRFDAWSEHPQSQSPEMIG